MAERLADAIANKLAVHIGPNVAKMSIDGFIRKKGIGSRDALTPSHIPALLAEVRPMLNVIIGRGPAESVLAENETMR